MLANTQLDAAEDLLHAVANAPTLSALATFNSVRIGVSGGSLTFSIEEVTLHSSLLDHDGRVRRLSNRATLPEYAMSRALLIDDLHVRGRSILQIAS
ncbi:hypothetical protein NB037_15140 [Rathayibacter sp. ZW T2_19]|uniref:Uncharacterized protein n=1 Tax=Rathayibacter rubneri TaxID=2950106 RepID=A0A9X2IU81_9MICO|nr:hypothetical protein [Rathayibacter rubneri]MCM6763752.1 hypothetical protein [Rathayibacter rubneri]